MPEPYTPPFQPWPKIARLNRTVIVTEKIDGTNACVVVEGYRAYAQSRKRIITPTDDNYGFAAWVAEHEDELLGLGDGYHFGEWYGAGIQRGYGLDHQRFALFNAQRWGGLAQELRPLCCGVVPVIAHLDGFDSFKIKLVLEGLRTNGSYAAPGFMRPEGIVVWHTAARASFKALLEGDDIPKGAA